MPAFLSPAPRAAILVVVLVVSLTALLVPAAMAASAEPSPTQPGALVAGAVHTCGITDAGAAICWGYNGGGQIDVPRSVAFSSLAAGAAHTCGFTDAGTVRCWGSNTRGQATVPSGMTFTTLAAGDRHTCGITDAGTVRCWGDNTYGQWDPHTPVGVAFTSIAAGAFHMCGITDAGATRCWGDNDAGRAAVPAGVTFTSLAAGDHHTCGIITGGTVRCWGRNDAGQGNAPGVTFTSLAAGAFHTCGITDAGTARCWGAKGLTQAPTGVTFTSLAAGNSHTCGITAAGTVRCWGSNTYGQRNVPGGVRFGADLLPPQIISSLGHAANPAGWHNSPVTISYACTDNFGEPDCPVAFTVEDEGAGQSVTATAADGAGLTASVTDTVSLDMTSPAVDTHIDVAANAAGWHRSSPTVEFSCADGLSGVATCADAVTVVEDGAGQEVSGEGSDVAGNSSSTTVIVNVDTEGPAISASVHVPANAAGWHRSAPTVEFSCADGLSGVATCADAVTVMGDGAGLEVSGEGSDVAGNSTSATVIVNVDTEGPAISASVDVPANAAGWHRSAPTVEFSCADGLSGVATCADAVTVMGDGAGLEVTGEGSDVAGNSTSTTVSVNVDTEAPTTTMSPQIAGSGLSGTIVDSLSGPAGVTVVLTSPLGGGPATVSTVLDCAGMAVDAMSIAFQQAVGTCTWSADAPPGVWSVSLIGTDVAGNDEIAHDAGLVIIIP